MEKALGDNPKHLATVDEEIKESCLRKRTVCRRYFTIAFKALSEKLLEGELCEQCELQELLLTLDERAKALFEVDHQLQEVLLRLPISEDEMLQIINLDETSKREVDYKVLKAKCMKLLQAQDSVHTSQVSNYVSASSASIDKPILDARRFKLPKIDFKQFDGNIMNWLCFWGQFRKIDSDKSIDDDDKFQYLIQATEPGSSARELVESYPLSGANYHKALEQMKARFAKDELLIQCYVRKLLDLVMFQSNSGEVQNLRSLYDKINTQLRALETLGVTSEKYAAMLYPLIESAIPEGTLRLWERSTKTPEQDQLQQLMEFLRLEVDCEEKVQLAKNAFKDGVRSKEPPATCTFVTTDKRSSDKKGSEVNESKVNRWCIWCDKTTHFSTECIETKKMTLEQKKDFLKSKKACLICLRVGHFASRCRQFPKCLNCTKRHTFVMCPEIICKSDNQTSTSTMESSKSKVVTNAAQDKKDRIDSDGVFLCHRNFSTLLQTVIVNLVCNGKIVKVRALFDSGAQRSYISKQIVRELGINPVSSQMIGHYLFGGVETAVENHKLYQVNVVNLSGNFEFIISVLDKEKLCGYLPRLQDATLYQKMQKLGVNLNDSDDECSEIGLLIGADYSGCLFTGEVVQVSDTLTAMNTKLGWVLQGRIINTCSAITMYTANCHSIADLWDLETIGIKDPAQTKKNEVVEREIMNFYKDTVKVNEEGRYEVNLPWKEDAGLLSNKELALKRLHSTTRRLLRTGNFVEYDSSLKDWLENGIIEQVEGDDSGHYLAHYAVIRESSSTTRVRPVFDASARDGNGKSLNSSLEPGINLLELIPTLLTDFRKHEFGVTADIKKAFLQISLAEADRKYLQFLWWADDERRELITYRHCRVVFGVTSSPFLLNATIRHHLESEYVPSHLKVTAEKLKLSFYVDNCLTSCTSIEKTSEFIEQSKELMQLAKMDLRGWVVGPSNEETTLSILGLLWNTKSDCLFINSKSLKYNGDRITKRLILSFAHRVFDPVGFTCPVSMKVKLILRNVHELKLGWDSEVPSDIAKKFLKWVNKLSALESVRIPRRLTQFSLDKCEVSIHTFCDASKDAYAAAVFLCCRFEGEVNVQLMAAKSRVSPVKEKSDISTPRLELLAAVLGVRLYTQFKNAFKHVCYFWSDSNVVLTWIKKEGDWAVFVKNRVKEIRQTTNMESWHHVPGAFNVADLPSRGCEADVLRDSLWWEGPTWLKLDVKDWPVSVDDPFTQDVSQVTEEVKVSTSISAMTDKFSENLLYFSKYSSIVRMMAWILRFYYNCRSKRSDCAKGELQLEEIENAEKVIFKVIQKEEYGDCKTYKDLCTMIDYDGLIKVRTKLFSEEVSSSYKFPILLPAKHLIIERLVIQKHRELLHAGTQTLIANLRQCLWITGVRVLVKRVSRRCTICRRYKAGPYKSPLVPLPTDRTRTGKPFEISGVDLAGPLFLRSGEKVWIVLFTCAVYRAIHLELVPSLSTDDFLLSFRRFMARRGRVHTVYSDNGTNFVGAKNLFKKIDWDKVVSQVAIKRIKWNLIPPGAPWWGGWWERMVRTVKELLRRVLGKASLTLLELQTILCECEAVINSRPLSCITDEADVPLQAITPAMFLQPLQCSEVPDLDQLDARSLNVRVKYLQKLRDDLKVRFRNEYLSLLVLKGKDTFYLPKVGDLVLVENTEKRSSWPLGVIIELYEGKDGCCRVAKVKTTRGEYTRSIRSLYALESM